MSNTNYTPGAFLISLQDLYAGLTSDLPSGLAQIAVGGKVSSVADLQAEVQGYVTLYATAAQAATAHAKAVQARDAEASTVISRYEGIRSAIKAIWGKKSPDLIKFGLAPDKPRPPLTTAQEQARIAKAAATRKARGTLGKKQKAAIKGQVPSPTTQATAAPAAAPTAASASTSATTPEPTPTPAAGPAAPAPKPGG